MIVEYHRPETIDQALELLRREQPVSVPLAGGTALNRRKPGPAVVAVDLQALGLDTLERKGNVLEMGATVRLQTLLEQREELGLPEALEQAIRHEASYNLRQAATVAGTLVACDGRSPFTTALLALDATLTLLPGEEQMGLGDLLPLRQERLRGRLITRVAIPLHVQLSYEYVARTPADLPIVCAAAAAWPSKRMRLALGGFGGAPLLAFDGTESLGIETAAHSAYSQAGDEWASAEYRAETARVLARRAADKLAA